MTVARSAWARIASSNPSNRQPSTVRFPPPTIRARQPAGRGPTTSKAQWSTWTLGPATWINAGQEAGMARAGVVYGPGSSARSAST